MNISGISVEYFLKSENKFDILYRVFYCIETVYVKVNFTSIGILKKENIMNNKLHISIEELGKALNTFGASYRNIVSRAVFADCVKSVIDRLQQDPGMAWAWHCKIVDTLKSNVQFTDAYVSTNKTAAELMQSLFDTDMNKNSYYLNALRQAETEELNRKRLAELAQERERLQGEWQHRKCDPRRYGQGGFVVSSHCEKICEIQTEAGNLLILERKRELYETLSKIFNAIDSGMIDGFNLDDLALFSKYRFILVLIFREITKDILNSNERKTIVLDCVHTRKVLPTDILHRDSTASDIQSILVKLNGPFNHSRLSMGNCRKKTESITYEISFALEFLR